MLAPHHKRQADAEAELLKVKQEVEAAEVEASDARVAQRGWPINVVGEGEVMVVNKRFTDAARFEFVVEAEDGSEFVPSESERGAFERVKRAPAKKADGK